MLKKMAERRAFVLFGARNVNMKIRWSAERCHMSERGMLKKKPRSAECQCKNGPERGALETPGWAPTNACHVCIPVALTPWRQRLNVAYETTDECAV